MHQPSACTWGAFLEPAPALRRHGWFCVVAGWRADGAELLRGCGRRQDGPPPGSRPALRGGAATRPACVTDELTRTRGVVEQRQGTAAQTHHLQDADVDLAPANS